jgi:hypothetical protein
VEAAEGLPANGVSVGVLGRLTDTLEYVVHDGYLRQQGKDEGLPLTSESVVYLASGPVAVRW